MLFSSITFLYYFLPITLGLYFLAPKQYKNSILLLSSILFYGWGEPKYIVLMLISVTLGYVLGIAIENAKTEKGKKIYCGLSVAFSLSFLLYFKYANFFVENWNSLTGLQLSLRSIALPIGISFYTFQMISYTIDVYRGEKAQRNWIHLATYIAMFPQLIAGPIVRYADIAKQLTYREHSFEKASEGIQRFLTGLAKKILIANQLGELCQMFRVTTEPSVLYVWLYGIAFSLHIYFDFSGYSDMAIGLGKILGFDFLENFNYPFMAKSITDFWRRWHISLSTWFRDYVYIPMGGNRVSKLKWYRNILIVWLLTGFWHGAAWNFVVWGLFFAVLLMIEKIGFHKVLENIKGFSRIYVLFLVMVSFIIFNANGMKEAVSDIAGLFGGGNFPLISNEAVYVLKNFAFILLIAAVGATNVPKLWIKSRLENEKLAIVRNILRPIFVVAVLFLVTAYLADGSFNPFLYFRF